MMHSVKKYTIQMEARMLHSLIRNNTNGGTNDAFCQEIHNTNGGTNVAFSHKKQYKWRHE